MIEVRNLTKIYGTKTALSDVSFQVDGAGVIGLLGLNGAGKSTTMNIMAGCLSAGNGSVLIDGEDILKEPLKVKSKMGYLPELPPLYVDMRVSEYLNFVFALKKVKANKTEHLDKICQMAGISDVRHRLIKNLSKGYRQRVGLAQALIGEPEILILDEPTVGLDPSQILEMRRLITDIGKTRTVFLSSHIMQEIKAVCQRVLVLKTGSLIADGKPEDLEREARGADRCVCLIAAPPDSVKPVLLASPNIKAVHLLGHPEEDAYEYRIDGLTGKDIRKELFYLLAKNDMPLYSSRGASATLEDVFLGLVGAKEESK